MGFSALGRVVAPDREQSSPGAADLEDGDARALELVQRLAVVGAAGDHHQIAGAVDGGPICDEASAHAYLMDCFIRWVSLDDAGRFKVVPENLLRFVRYCEAEGRLTPETREEVETLVAREKDQLMAASVDPKRRSHARRMIEKLLLKGVDPADPRAFVSLLHPKKAGPMTRTFPEKEPRSA